VNPTPEQQAEAAKAAINTFLKLAPPTGMVAIDTMAETAAGFTALLAGLIHLTDINGLDWAEMTEVGYELYDAGSHVTQ